MKRYARWFERLRFLSNWSAMRLTREEHDTKMADAIGTYQPDYVVLAKSICVFDAGFCGALPEQIINIHRSFLPAFIGARPYHRPYEARREIIGTLPHWRMIIWMKAQSLWDVIHVDHTYTAEDMMRAGLTLRKRIKPRALSGFWRSGSLFAIG